MNNNVRAQRAQIALEAYREIMEDYKDRPEEPDLQAIGDLISDLLHLARELGEKDPGHILAMAEINFNVEKEDEREEEEA